MEKSLIEKDFLDMLETHKRVIYKVCYLYASDTEHLNDLYQDTVLNLWRASGFPGRQLAVYVDIPDQPEYLHLLSAEIKIAGGSHHPPRQPGNLGRERRGQVKPAARTVPADSCTEPSGACHDSIVAGGKELRGDCPDYRYFQKQCRRTPQPHQR